MTKRLQSTVLNLTAALLVLVLVGQGNLYAQDLEVLCDWEDGGTCWSWDFTDGATTFDVVDNPKAEGINTSAKVQQFTPDPNSGFPIFLHDYAANGEPPVDFNEWPVYKLKVYTEVQNARLNFKFENDGNTEFQEITVDVTPGAWEELTFDFTGRTTSTPLIKMVIFPNFLTQGEPKDGAWYFDDLVRAKVVNVATEDDQVPTSFALDQNYPNPFNPTTQIRYTTDQSGQIELKVYNLLGVEVATLVDQVQPAGEHAVSFDGSDLPSGVYLYRLTQGTKISTKQMMLVK